MKHRSATLLLAVAAAALVAAALLAGGADAVSPAAALRSSMRNARFAEARIGEEGGSDPKRLQKDPCGACLFVAGRVAGEAHRMRLNREDMVTKAQTVCQSNGLVRALGVECGVFDEVDEFLVRGGLVSADPVDYAAFEKEPRLFCKKVELCGVEEKSADIVAPLPAVDREGAVIVRMKLKGNATTISKESKEWGEFVRTFLGAAAGMVRAPAARFELHQHASDTLAEIVIKRGAKGAPTADDLAHRIRAVVSRQSNAPNFPPLLEQTIDRSFRVEVVPLVVPPAVRLPPPSVVVPRNSSGPSCRVLLSRSRAACGDSFRCDAECKKAFGEYLPCILPSMSEEDRVSTRKQYVEFFQLCERCRNRVGPVKERCQAFNTTAAGATPGTMPSTCSHYCATAFLPYYKECLVIQLEDKKPEERAPVELFNRMCAKCSDTRVSAVGKVCDPRTDRPTPYPATCLSNCSNLYVSFYDECLATEPTGVPTGSRDFRATCEVATDGGMDVRLELGVDISNIEDAAAYKKEMRKELSGLLTVPESRLEITAILPKTAPGGASFIELAAREGNASASASAPASGNATGTAASGSASGNSTAAPPASASASGNSTAAPPAASSGSGSGNATAAPPAAASGNSTGGASAGGSDSASASASAPVANSTEASGSDESSESSSSSAAAAAAEAKGSVYVTVRVLNSDNVLKESPRTVVGRLRSLVADPTSELFKAKELSKTVSTAGAARLVYNTDRVASDQDNSTSLALARQELAKAVENGADANMLSLLKAIVSYHAVVSNGGSKVNVTADLAAVTYYSLVVQKADEPKVAAAKASLEYANSVERNDRASRQAVYMAEAEYLQAVAADASEAERKAKHQLVSYMQTVDKGDTKKAGLEGAIYAMLKDIAAKRDAREINFRRAFVDYMRDVTSGNKTQDDIAASYAVVEYQRVVAQNGTREALDAAESVVELRKAIAAKFPKEKVDLLRAIVAYTQAVAEKKDDDTLKKLLGEINRLKAGGASSGEEEDGSGDGSSSDSDGSDDSESSSDDGSASGASASGESSEDASASGDSSDDASGSDESSEDASGSDESSEDASASGESSEDASESSIDLSSGEESSSADSGASEESASTEESASASESTEESGVSESTEESASASASESTTEESAEASTEESASASESTEESSESSTN